MEGLFDKTCQRGETFVEFGRSRLTRRRPIDTLELSDDAASVRRALRSTCPGEPGVYGMVDAAGQLIYVGMSGSLRDRLLTYFTKGPADKKEQRVAAHAARLVWEVQPHELLALLRELELIRSWRPRLNARGRPGRHEIGYIYISGGLAPNLRAGRRIPENATHHWGPLVLNRRVRSAVTKLNHLFQLRDCPDRTPVRYAEQLTLLAGDDHPACVRGELGTCLAPCTGRRGQDDYARNLLAARALLDGRDLSLIDEHQQRMLEAAQRQEYERAAAYRDTWESLRLLHDQLAILRSGQRDCWFVYPFAKTAGSANSRTQWLIVAGGLAAAIVPEPRTASAADRVTRLLEQVTRDHQLTHPDEVAQLRVVAGWFRQHPEERETTFSFEQARARCGEVLGLVSGSDGSVGSDRSDRSVGSVGSGIPALR